MMTHYFEQNQLKNKAIIGAISRMEVSRLDLEQYFKDIHLSTNIWKSLRNTLNKKAIEIFVKLQKMKKKRHLLRLKLKKIARQQYAQACAILEEQLFIIKEQMQLINDLAYYADKHKRKVKKFIAHLSLNKSQHTQREAICEQIRKLLNNQASRLRIVYIKSTNKKVASLKLSESLRIAIIKNCASYHDRKQQITLAKQAIQHEFQLPYSTLSCFQKQLDCLNDPRMIALEKKEQRLIAQQIASLRIIGTEYHCGGLKYASNDVLQALIKDTDAFNIATGFYSQLSAFNVKEAQLNKDLQSNLDEMEECLLALKENQRLSEATFAQLKSEMLELENSDSLKTAKNEIKKLEAHFIEANKSLACIAKNKPSRMKY